jgi:phospholipid/cholesterol/gamma-HCH transport system substrate-binding protein
MAKREEEIKVGLLVVIAVALFLAALVLVGGVNLFRTKRVTYTTYFKFAGGLEPGAFVRFGGLKVGVVESAEIDPQDSTRVRVKVAVKEKTPVRQNSRAKISTLGPLRFRQGRATRHCSRREVNCPPMKSFRWPIF